MKTINRFNRKSIRLKEYDYSQPGEYFITICTYKHKCIFGDIINEEMMLSEHGLIARKCWDDIPKHFPFVTLDVFVIMTNHIHGIIIINHHGRDVQLNVPTRLSPQKNTLSVIIRTYKAAVTTQCYKNGNYDFKWQPRYYEHVIRDDRDLINIRDYIINNPLKWFFDNENPNKS